MAKKETYRNVRKERYTQVSNGLLNDKEATLQAKGLLSIFLSNSEDWEIHMANIISRSKNGRDAHYTVVKELIKLGYFARIQVLGEKGRFEEMVYLFSDIKRDVADEIKRMNEWASEQGKILKVEYLDSKKTPEESPVTESQETEKAEEESQYNNNTKGKNTKNNNTNKYIKIDDDKRTSPPEDTDHLNEIISEVYDEVKDELTKRSYQAIVRKVVDKHRQGKIGKGNFRDYLTSAIANKVEELELRRIKEQAQESLKQRAADTSAVPERPVPFYNWLEE
jgi:hypothetical protein